MTLEKLVKITQPLVSKSIKLFGQKREKELLKVIKQFNKLQKRYLTAEVTSAS